MCEWFINHGIHTWFCVELRYQRLSDIRYRRYVLDTAQKRVTSKFKLFLYVKLICFQMNIPVFTSFVIILVNKISRLYLQSYAGLLAITSCH